MRVSAGALALVAACGSREFDLAPPDLAGAESLVLAAFDGGKPDVRAFAASATIADSLEVGALEGFELYALVYAAPLADLALEPGPVAPAVPPAPSRALPPARAELVAHAGDGGAPSGWDPLPARRGQLASLRVAGAESPCARFSVEAIPVQVTESSLNDWGFVFPEGDGAVIAGVRRGGTFLIRADGSFETLPQNPTLRPRVGALDAQGGRWVGDIYGDVWYGAPGSRPESWTRTATSPLSQIDAIDVAPDGSELVVLASSGAVGRRTAEGAWTEIHRLERSDAGLQGGVIRLGPNDFLAANAATTGIVRIRGGVASVEQTSASAGFTLLAHVEGMGIVAGSGAGELFLRQGDGWMSLGDSHSGFYVIGMEAYEDGLLFASPYGNVGQLVAGEFCPPFNPVTFFVRYFHPFGRDLLLLGEEAIPRVAKAAILRRR